LLAFTEAFSFFTEVTISRFPFFCRLSSYSLIRGCDFADLEVTSNPALQLYPFCCSWVSSLVSSMTFFERMHWLDLPSSFAAASGRAFYLSSLELQSCTEDSSLFPLSSCNYFLMACSSLLISMLLPGAFGARAHTAMQLPIDGDRIIQL